MQVHTRHPANAPTALTAYDEPLVRRLIEKVTIYEDKFTVEFKSGVTIDVDE
jgi:site-specific DNA recombinase